MRPTDCYEIVGSIRQKSSKYKSKPACLNLYRAIAAVLVHFTLKLDDGTTAESTRNNGKPALFRLGDASLSEGLEQHLLGAESGR